MAVEFHKMHGLGNDFILLDLRNQEFPIDASLARQLANRRTGIGCDQILILRQPPGKQYLAAFEIWNSDGSRAEQCGNGVRCLGLYLHQRSETPSGKFLLSGPAGVIKIECLDNDLVRVDMGQPVFDASRVPVLLEAVDGWYTLPGEQEDISLGAVSMGNPHALMVVEDISAVNIAKLGSFISQHPAFPEGCNAGFAEISDRKNIKLRVYERGAGETLACGSGACAAVAILCRTNLTDDTVHVTQAGGNLIINWTGEENPVIMVGTACHVFKGTIA
jgi:diaminopimelate epimerase